MIAEPGDFFAGFFAGLEQGEARIDINLAAVDFDRPEVGHRSIFGGNVMEL